MQEFSIKLKKTKRTKKIVLIGLSLLYLIFIAAYLSKEYRLPSALSFTLFIFERVIKSILDSWMFVKLLNLLNYFVQKRKEKLELIDQKLTYFNKFIIGVTIFLIICTYYKSVCSLIFSIMNAAYKTKVLIFLD